MPAEPTPEQVKAAAAALANQRVMRNGSPPISNVLEMIERQQPRLYEQVVDDARAALKAALDLPEGSA